MASIDEEIKSKFMNDRHRFITNLIYTAGWILNESERRLRPFGLSNQQFNILRILRGTGDWLPMSEVKLRMIERSPNATRLADKLLKKGWIDRKRSDADRRVVFVRINEGGLAVLKRIDEDMEENGMILIDKITEEEARKISKILDHLRS